METKASRFHFRAWDPVGKKMLPVWDLARLPDGRDVEYWGGHIMQSTGLADKNGVEVFESDILKVDPPHPAYQPTIAVVEFGEHETSDDYYASRAYGWYIFQKNPNQETSFAQISQPFEVIGNSYENPELIKA